MDDVRKQVQPNASRTVVIAAVVLLIVIAIAGIVLAGRKSSPALGTAAALPDTPAASTPLADAGPTSGPNEVIFAAGSEKPPRAAAESITRFAENARSVGGTVRMTGRYLTGADKAKDLELAKARTAAVRHALESNGIKPEQMQVELVEMPTGALTPAEANRIELSLR